MTRKTMATAIVGVIPRSRCDDPLRPAGRWT